ncbi:hypothetical protein BJV78DRAFT_1116630 [Lactifluus subvellereus]|nr:hypothetical protein BJV78DRAFT_1116630 [Lactifluus subvellereus]
MAAHDQNDEQPTESTPLVTNRPTVQSQHPSSSLPPLTPVVNHIRLHGLQVLDQDPSLFLAPSASLPGQVSFKLLVLLKLYLLAKTPASSIGTDIWEQWSKERASLLDVEELQRRAVHIWEEFLDVSRSTQEIEECLWTPFPVEKGKSLSVRVVDVLKDLDAPPALVSHRLVILSLLHTWTHGKAINPARSLSRRILQRFSSVATPREILLMTYSTASLLKRPTLVFAPLVLVSGAFLFSLPETPFPGDTSYSILLGALLSHVLLLHLPRIPSPIFLVSPPVTLPLATLLWHQFTRTLYPGVLFYLPATLLASYFLSIALEDTIPHFPIVLTLTQPAPMEIRLAFSALWCILVFLMMVSSVPLVLFNASLPPLSSQAISPWDRYSLAVGLRSRRIFATAIVAYSVPYYFPPPFNLLQILFVRIPQLLSRLFGWKQTPATGEIEGVLWHLTTGLLVFTAKRRRTGPPQIGAPSEADKAITPFNLPSSSAFSTRTLKTNNNHVLPLATLCARLFVANFPKLSKDPRQWEPTKTWQVVVGPQLKSLPDSTTQTLFAMLRSSCPHLLSHELVKEYFLRGDSVTLTSGMGGERSPVSKYTIGAVATMGSGLVRLHLIGFDKMTDQSFAAVISRHPSLEDLSLSGCTLVGPKTVKAVAKACPSLTSINLNYTSVTPLALAPLLRNCKERLEVLKVAGISSWVLSQLLNAGDFSLPALRTLKLRETSLSDASLSALAPLVPNIRRVDLSFTDIRRPLLATPDCFANLEKLSLTSTSVSQDDLVSALSAASRLRTLNIGALGGCHGKRSAYGDGISTMTFTDNHLRSLTTVLSRNTIIENISLVGNKKLARDAEIIAEFILLVGRRLKKLNLSGLPFLRSSDLQHLAPGDPADSACSLRELSLNSTNIDDNAVAYISSCPSLEILEAAGSKFSSEGLFAIIDACPKLAVLNLTRCRGVSVADRRHFFEVRRDQGGIGAYP